MDEIDEATDRVLLGPAKTTRKITDKEKKLVSIHEAGHAVIGLKLEDAHYRKIDLSDGIYVVNMDGYIGTSVKKEIEYAERHGKEVLYHYNQ